MAGTGLQGAFALDALEQLLQQRMAAALQERAFQVQQQHLRVGEQERAREARAREQETEALREQTRQLREEALAAAGQARTDAATTRFFEGNQPAGIIAPEMAARGRALGYGGALRTIAGEPGDPQAAAGFTPPSADLTALPGMLVAPGYRPEQTQFAGGAAEQGRIRQQAEQQAFAGTQAATRAQERAETAAQRTADQNEAARQRQLDREATVRLTAGLAEAGRATARTEKAKTAAEAREQGLQVVRSHAQETLGLLDQLQESTPEGGTRLRPDVATVVGGSRNLGGGITRLLPATAARAAENKINQLKSRLVVDLMGEMKSQSKTGATGFGQLNIKELQLLERAASRLSDPNLSEADYNAALSEVRTKVSKVLQPGPGESSVPAAAPEVPAHRRSAAEWLQWYRGTAAAEGR